MLSLLVENVWTYIDGAYPFSIVDKETSYLVHGRWFVQAFKSGQWDGRKRFREFDRKRKQHKFPTGLLSRVTTALDLADYPYELLDQRDFHESTPVMQLANGSGPQIRLDKGKYSFQEGVVEDCLLHGRGTVWVATGGGKTEIAAAVLASYDRPSLFLTHRKTLLHQTRDRLQLRLNRPIGIIGDGLVQPEKITVAMVQTLSKKKDPRLTAVMDQADVVIGDEIHHLESKSWWSVFCKLQAPHRFGLTATPCFDGAGMNLIAMTGDVIARASAADLIDRGVLVQPRIWFVRVDDDQLPKSTAYPTAYANGIVRSAKRNARLVHVASVFKAEGKSCVTLVRHLNHGDLLADLLCQRGVRTAFVHGKHKKSEREDFLARLWSGDLDHLVAQAEILGEGVDLPMLQCVINATGTRGGGSKQSSVEHEVGRGTIQFLGRLLRSAPGKLTADYVDFTDTSHKFLTEASRERVRTLEEQGYGPWINYWNERPVELERELSA